MKKYAKILLSLSLVLSLSQSGAVYAAGGDAAIAGVSNFAALAFLTGFTLILFSVLFFVLTGVFYFFIKKQTALYATEEVEISVEEERDPFWKWFWNNFNAAAPIAKEKDILFHHEYDGIRELDNDLPPWWKYGFYLTIVASVIYMYVYTTSVGESAYSIKEFKAEMAVANAEKQAYLEKVASLINESNVENLTDEASLNAGKKLFLTNCKTCHGANGEGLAGPNLTDEFWLHGGDIKDIYSVVKYGVAGKTMQSWQEKLTPKEMQLVSSYIISLEGSNPPNAKEAQGEKFVREKP